MKRFVFSTAATLLLAPCSFAILDVNENGVSDLWEKQFNEGELFDVSFDPQGDDDHDKWSNVKEAAAGTDPFDANPPDGLVRPLAVYSPEVMSEPDQYGYTYTITPEAVTVSWPTLVGKQYTLLFSPDLSAGSWIPIGDSFIGNGNQIIYGFTIYDSDKRFWRVAVCDVDSDSDELNDHEEHLLGTNPAVSDSDWDGLADHAEILAGSDPVNQDTDGDGIPDSIDGQPLSSSHAFPDQDGDGIPDGDDPDPENPRGPAPTLVSETATGNPTANLVSGEQVRFVITVSNPGGSMPTASDLTFHVNGAEKSASITAISDAPPSTRRFLLSWDAETTDGYPSRTLQNLTLRFRDSQQATSWFNLARIDVAEWEGIVAMSPVYYSSSDQYSVGLKVDTHLSGRKYQEYFGNKMGGANLHYRGPVSIPIMNQETSSVIATFHIPAGIKSPMFMTRFASNGVMNSAIVEAGDYSAFPHNSLYIYNNSPAQVRFDWSGIVTDVPGNSIFIQDYGTAWGADHIDLHWWRDGQMWPLASTSWAHAPAFTTHVTRYVVSCYDSDDNPQTAPRVSGVSNFVKLPASITPHMAGTPDVPGMPIHPQAIEKENTPFIVGANTFHKVLFRAEPIVEEWTNGVKLRIARWGSQGSTPPEEGIHLYQTAGGQPLPMDLNGDILLSPTVNQELFESLTSEEGLTLFLKRDGSALERHYLGIVYLSKYQTGVESFASAVSLLPVDFKLRIPDIADNGGETTYTYETVASLPWGRPLPGVEIIDKSISGDQLSLSAEIYDVLADVAENDAQMTPEAWVNERKIVPAAGDKSGVYRLTDYAYTLYPGRNEVTVSIRNSLGVAAHHTVVIEGDGQQGYTIVDEPAKVPQNPTYPVVCELNGLNLDADQKITLSVAGKTVEVGGEVMEETNGGLFRSGAFVSLAQPESADQTKIDLIPSDKPVFLSDLDYNIGLQIERSAGASVAWSAIQSGFDLVSPNGLEVKESGDLTEDLVFKVRGFGSTPIISAIHTAYRDEEAEHDISAAFTSAYQVAHTAQGGESSNGSFSFVVDGVELEEGYNLLELAFTDGESGPSLANDYHSFRFSEPTKAGVRVFSANRIKDTVIEGVTGRMGEIWYPVDGEADLVGFGAALAKSGCRVIGMTDVSSCFEDAPLKRSFLVRGPPGRTFQAFDDLYAALGREQRSQTFDTDGTHGASLAGELNRVQTDANLPDSAKNALALEIAGTYQFHNGFEDFVPKTHQPYVDPGTGTPQPNSWTMRGSSLPDHLQSNPTPWTVTNTLSDPARAVSASGIIKLDTTAEDTAYYAATSTTAPWDLSGARAISLRFKLLEHDAVNGADGAFQLAVGDGTRTWTCQVSPSQIKAQGTAIAIPASIFPDGLIDGKFHTLQFNFSGTGNDALVSIDGEVLTATATAQTGTLNGIAFGDPGTDIAGKLEVDSLGFENSDLRYQYGIYDADDYAESDEIDGLNNVMLYLRSKGLPFRTSAVARWVKLLDPRVHEWLLETYTGTRWDGAEQELNIYTKKDVWLGSIVDLNVEEQGEGVIFRKTTKATNTLCLDTEETKIFSTDTPRAEIELAGILVSWVRQEFEYQQWLAGVLDEDAGFVTQILMKQENTTRNIKKWSKRAEMTIELGGEIVLSMSNEFADYAFTINEVRQGEYMAMIGFIPGVPGTMAKTLKVIRKSDGVTLDVLDKLSEKVPGFPGGILKHVDQYNQERIINRGAIFGDSADSEVIQRAQALISESPVSGFEPGLRSGRELLSTFHFGAVRIFKTTEPIKLYRTYKHTPGVEPRSGFFSLEMPENFDQAVLDYALIDPSTNLPWQQYDRVLEIEVPAGKYLYLGEAAQMGNATGGGLQVWIDDDTVSNLPWADAVAASWPLER